MLSEMQNLTERNNIFAENWKQCNNIFAEYKAIN